MPDKTIRRLGEDEFLPTTVPLEEIPWEAYPEKSQILYKKNLSSVPGGNRYGQIFIECCWGEDLGYCAIAYISHVALTKTGLATYKEASKVLYRGRHESSVNGLCDFLENNTAAFVATHFPGVVPPPQANATADCTAKKS